MSVVRQLKYKIQNGELSIVDITKKQNDDENGGLNKFWNWIRQLF